MKYPKLFLLTLTIILAIFIFYQGKTHPQIHDFIISLGYLGVFIGGIFYAYGFTAAPATAVFLIIAKEQNIILAAIIGGMGALISDILIFQFVRHSFKDEIKRLKHEKFLLSIEKTGKKITKYFTHLPKLIAGILIASPLPTEAGVALMASIKEISIKKFMIIAYILHTIGIFIILFIGMKIN